MHKFHIIAFTHRNLGLEAIGKLHIELEDLGPRLAPIKETFGLEELLFLSTCNRVEFLFRSDKEVTTGFCRSVLSSLYPAIGSEALEETLLKATMLHGLDAVKHLFFVASSLDSLVLGEREIITQVRQAFEHCNQLGFTGDATRLVIQKTIETAKQVYSETSIAKKPVSVVNLAYRRILDHGLKPSDSIVVVGAGQTIEAMLGNFSKHPLENLTIYNRTFEKANNLAKRYGHKAKPLSDLFRYEGRPDIIVSCTGSSSPVITEEVSQVLFKEGHPRLMVDLAVPNDVSPAVVDRSPAEYINVESLKEEARKNLKEREKDLFRCEEIVAQRLAEFEQDYKTRQLERAMLIVPQKIKEIREQAIGQKFSGKIGRMSNEDRETLMEVLDYLEKKYMAIPMRMAKEVVLNMDIKDKIIG